MKITTADGREIGKSQTPQHGCGPLDGEAGNTTSYLEKSQQSQTLFNGSPMLIQIMKRRLLSGMPQIVHGKENGSTIETTCIQSL